MASAKSLASARSQPLSFFASPRKSSERMTPEFPRAPRSMAFAAQDAASPSVGKLFFPSSAAAAPIVRLMLVPVSPSGTGKTFSSLMSCLFCTSAALAHWMISPKSAASMNSLKRAYLRTSCNSDIRLSR